MKREEKNLKRRARILAIIEGLKEKGVKVTALAIAKRLKCTRQNVHLYLKAQNIQWQEDDYSEVVANLHKIDPKANFLQEIKRVVGCRNNKTIEDALNAHQIPYFKTRNECKAWQINELINELCFIDAKSFSMQEIQNQLEKKYPLCFIDQENLSTGLRGLGFNLRKSKSNKTDRIFSNLNIMDLTKMNLAQVRGILGNTYSSRTLRNYLHLYKIQYKMVRGVNHGK